MRTWWAAGEQLDAETFSYCDDIAEASIKFRLAAALNLLSKNVNAVCLKPYVEAQLLLLTDSATTVPDRDVSSGGGRSSSSSFVSGGSDVTRRLAQAETVRFLSIRTCVG